MYKDLCEDEENPCEGYVFGEGYVFFFLSPIV